MDIYFVPSGSVYGKRTSGHLTLSLDSTPTVYTTCNWHVIPPSDAGICGTNSHWIQQVYRHHALVTPTWFDNVTLPRQKSKVTAYAKYSICERDIVTGFCRLVQRSEATIYFSHVTSEYPARWFSQVKLARDLPQVMTQPSRHDCTRDTATKYCHIARHGVYTTLHCHVR